MEPVLLLPFNATCEALLWAAVVVLWCRLKVQAGGQHFVRGARRARRSFAGLLVRLGLERPVPVRAWRRAAACPGSGSNGGHNRSAPEVEEAVCRLCVFRPS